MPGAYEGWGLWIQGPLLLASFIASRRLLADVKPRWLYLVGFVVPVLAVFLLPPGRYHWSGHEGVYGELLAGALPADPSDLRSYRVMPLPSGVTWLLGQTLPEWLARPFWLAANRADLGLCLLLLGAAATSLAQDEDAPVLTLVLLGLTPALWAWSGTGFAILPAVSASAFALLAAARGHAPLTLLWAAMAAASRLEYLPVGLTAVALLRSYDWRRADRAGLTAAAAVCGIQGVLLVGKGSALPADLGAFDGLLAARNLQSLDGMLGFGVWGTAAVAVAVGLRTAFERDRDLAILLGGAGLAALQTLTVVDLGARHLLPLTMLLALGWGAAFPFYSPFGSRRSALVSAALIAWFVVLAVPDFAELRERYMTGPESIPAVWRCDDCTAPWQDTEGSPCLRVYPGGPVDPGDADAALTAADALDDGGCVLWALYDHAEVSGDARGERTERAVHLLDLIPLGWASRPGEDPWYLLGAGPGAAEHDRQP